MKLINWSVLFLILVVATASAVPDKIDKTDKTNKADKFNYVYIVRHGEKVSDKDFGLSPSGFEHANCLAGYYFKTFPHGAPKFAIAKMSSTERPAETAGIIAHKLDIETSDLSSKLKTKGIAQLILDKMATYHRVLVVWENTAIPKLARTLGCAHCKSWNYDPTFHKHDGNLFNSTWVLRYPKLQSYNLNKIDKLSIKFQDFDQNFNNGTCHHTFKYVHRNF